MAFNEQQEKQILDTLATIPNIVETLGKLSASTKPDDKTTPPATKPDDKTTPPATGGDPILDKIEAEKKLKATQLETTQEVERVINFIHGVTDFVEKNSSVLPEETKQILAVAQKETYDSHAQKAGSIQASIMKAYFDVQENLDALTGSQKKVVESYMKLSQTAKVSKASEIFESVFEPAVHAAARIKKADELTKAKSGEHRSSKSENAFLEKMRAKSQAGYNMAPKSKQ